MDEYEQSRKKRKHMLAALSMYDPDAIQLPLRRTRILSSEFQYWQEDIEKQIENLGHLRNVDPGASFHRIEEYVDKRAELLDDLHEYRRQGTNVLASNKPGLSSSECKALESDLNDLDKFVSKERSFIRTNDSKLKLSVSSYEGVYDNIGSAYAQSLVDIFPKPSSAQIKIPPKVSRSSKEQTAYRRRLIKKYHPEDLPTRRGDDETSWCPVNGPMDLGDLSAAHIVPYSIGEIRAARLFGCNESEGYQRVWGFNNGMMLSERVEEVFDKGGLVFVPLKKSEAEKGRLKMVILDPNQADRGTGAADRRTFGDMDGKPLQFKTDHLPSLHSLYIHALMSVLRRKRHNCTGWEKDIEKVFTGRIWSSASEEKLRKGTILALALEVGDLLPSMADKFAKEAIDESGAVDTDQDEITPQDKDTAVIVSGAWMSQDELQTWEELSGGFRGIISEQYH